VSPYLRSVRERKIGEKRKEEEREILCYNERKKEIKFIIILNSTPGEQN
jgi:hypothetical protein